MPWQIMLFGYLFTDVRVLVFAGKPHNMSCARRNNSIKRYNFPPFSTIYKKAIVLLLGLILFSPAPQITNKMLAAWSRLLGYYNPSVVQKFCRWKKYVFCSDCRLFPNLVHGASSLQWFEIDIVLEVSVCTADPECDSSNFGRNSLSQIG